MLCNTHTVKTILTSYRSIIHAWLFTLSIFHALIFCILTGTSGPALHFSQSLSPGNQVKFDIAYRDKLPLCIARFAGLLQNQAVQAVENGSMLKCNNK